MTVARLWWRPNRRIVLLFAAATILTSGLGVVYASWIRCDAGVTGAQCERFLTANPPSTAVTAILAILPILMGLTLGVDAVGRELEDGTAPFAWSIVGRRWRWLGERILPGAIATGSIALVSGAVNGVIVAALNPGHDITASFVGYGLWGPILLARALCGYAIGLALGTLLGRVVAAVALGLLLVTIVTPVALVFGRALEPAQVVPNGDSRLGDALAVQMGVLADGELISLNDALARAPADLDIGDKWTWVYDHYPSAQSWLLGSQMPTEQLREVAALGAVTLLLGALTFGVVTNRRP